MSGRSKNLTVAAFIFMIGLFVFCCAILALTGGHLKTNWAIYLLFGIIGAYISVVSGGVIFSAWKKPKFDGVFSISLPNSILMIAPCEMHGGKAVIYLGGSVKLYRGEITLFLKQKDGRSELGKAFLSGTKPLFRILVPSWFKWLGVKEAGTMLDFWPKGVNSSFDPVIICFVQTIARGDTIELSLDVASVLDIKVDDRHGNVCKSETVTVCFNT